MFRLPHDLSLNKKFPHFSSLLQNINNRTKNNKTSSRYLRSSSQINQIKPQSITTKSKRPKSSYNRLNYTKTETKNVKQAKNLNFQQGILISPCNISFKHIITQPKINNINYKMSNSGFLIEPCKIEPLFSQSRKQFKQMSPSKKNKGRNSSIQFFNKIISHQLSTKQKQKSKSLRRNLISPFKKQDLIAPWENLDYNFQSIRLSNKTY